VEYLVHTCKKDFKDDPTWTPYTLKERVKRDLNINVSIARCYRAKKGGIASLFEIEVSNIAFEFKYFAYELLSKELLLKSCLHVW
jgi:hypothetical protein